MVELRLFCFLILTFGQLFALAEMAYYVYDQSSCTWKEASATEFSASANRNNRYRVEKGANAYKGHILWYAKVTSAKVGTCARSPPAQLVYSVARRHGGYLLSPPYVKVFETSASNNVPTGWVGFQDEDTWLADYDNYFNPMHQTLMFDHGDLHSNSILALNGVWDGDMVTKNSFNTLFKLARTNIFSLAYSEDLVFSVTTNFVETQQSFTLTTGATTESTMTDTSTMEHSWGITARLKFPAPWLKIGTASLKLTGSGTYGSTTEISESALRTTESTFEVNFNTASDKRCTYSIYQVSLAKPGFVLKLAKYFLIPECD